MMGGLTVMHDGELVTLPFDFDWPPTIEGRFPNKPMLKMDEARFKRAFGDHAVWTQGKGPFAVMAYCGGDLTITRWPTLREAVIAKSAIDGGGCGGRCCKVHVIVEFDPDNGAKAREHAAIAKYLAEHGR